MQAATEPCARTLQLSPFQYKRTGDYYAEKWRIEMVKEPSLAKTWQWSGDANHPVLQVGANLLAEFIACLENERYEDYGIGMKEKNHESDSSKEELWFWRTMLP